ncbi:hypothetical protein AGMMS49921_02320 [Endomicrobiia bacterium]|nr:hypothetical protein AGMMS49921_02320 [Endomicrobiia bacterium]
MLINFSCLEDDLGDEFEGDPTGLDANTWDIAVKVAEKFLNQGIIGVHELLEESRKDKKDDDKEEDKLNIEEEKGESE